MASRVSALVRISMCGALAVVALSSCSKKVTAPNSRPVPEGDQNGQMLMLGWPEQLTTWFVVVDPGTPFEPADDFLGVAGQDFFADPQGLRTNTFDFSPANQLQPFRVDANGNAQEMFDFPLEPRLRFIGRGMDLYEFEDFSPPRDRNPNYFGRGAVDGVITTSSPVSNRLRVLGGFDDNLDFTPKAKSDAGDSVLDIVFTEDPRAAFYMVEVDVDAGTVLALGAAGSAERRLRALPSPLTPGTLPLHTLQFLLFPGQGLQGISLRGLTRQWPAVFYVRVTAFDGNGQMVNRLNDYLRTRGLDGDLIFAIYEPMGGTAVLMDPYANPNQPLEAPLVYTRNEAFAILEGFGGSPAPTPTRLDAWPVGRGSGSRVAPDLAQLRSNPLFSAETMRRNLARARQILDQHAATGTSSAPSTSRRVSTTPR